MLNDIFLKQSTFTLFLSPPGSGKTTMLFDIYENKNISIIYFSPLRALAEEFYTRASRFRNVFFISDFKSRDIILEQFTKHKKSLLISTPELFSLDLLKKVKQTRKILLVLDEFHLFYYWGLDFRPILWEITMTLANSSFPILALTATMDKPMLNLWKKDFLRAMDNLYLLDYKNQTLLNHPKKNIFFPASFKSAFNRRFIYELSKNKNETFLFFCKYRSTVKKWERWCNKYQINSLTCVGGESKDFMDKLKRSSNLKCIFATSTLSHGVNLPSISKVFINYNVNNIDFLIQMVGRGGRNGENFSIFTNNCFLSSKLKAVIEFIKAILFDTFILRYLC